MHGLSHDMANPCQKTYSRQTTGNCQGKIKGLLIRKMRPFSLTSRILVEDLTTVKTGRARRLEFLFYIPQGDLGKFKFIYRDNHKTISDIVPDYAFVPIDLEHCRHAGILPYIK